jgi:hypothetical protein
VTGAPALEALVASELARPHALAGSALVAEMRGRYRASLDALLFYGSCLRDGSDGVLDLYAIVRDYRSTYASRALALANAALPPNVFYLQSSGARAKLAVLSARDFARAASPRAIRPLVWARFCQPFAVLHARDAAATEAVAAVAAAAIRTAVTRGLGLLPADSGSAVFSPEALWTAVFRETYASELRPESDARVEGLYAAAPSHYDHALAAVLDELAAQGAARVAREGDRFRVDRAPGLLSRPRRARRLLAKSLSPAVLLKSALTFGDWLPYALWKLERHTGTRLEPSERQRRHPLLFAWPLVFRVLARRELR